MSINFERGRDPRSLIGIGLEKEIEKFLKPIISKYGFNLANSTIRSEAKIEFEQNSGLKITIDVKKHSDGTSGGDAWYVIVQLLPPYEEIKVQMEIPSAIFDFPYMAKTIAKNIEADFVPGNRMSEPKKLTSYLDYQYKNKNHDKF